MQKSCLHSRCYRIIAGGASKGWFEEELEDDQKEERRNRPLPTLTIYITPAVA